MVGGACAASSLVPLLFAAEKVPIDQSKRKDEMNAKRKDTSMKQAPLCSHIVILYVSVVYLLFPYLPPLFSLKK